MKKPLISIIIPVYNVEKYLSRCLNSVISQDYKNIEVILVDDGSTDNSLKICNNYCQRFNFIKVFSKRNEGLSSARNYGIKQAEGSFLVVVFLLSVLDSDFLTVFFVAFLTTTLLSTPTSFVTS